MQLVMSFERGDRMNSSKFSPVGQDQIKLLSVWLERAKNETQRKRRKGSITDAIHKVAKNLATRQRRAAASKLF